MYYSTIGLLAILILMIENRGIIRMTDSSIDQPVWQVYRCFLLAVLTYLFTDVLWGILESQKLGALLFIDTEIYFAAMAVSVYFWTQYTVTYLSERSSVFGRFLVYTGQIFLTGVMATVIVNVSAPILFWVDSESVYHARTIRYVILVFQIALLTLVSGYTFYKMAKSGGTEGKRYRTIALFGLIMAVFLTVQIWYPYLPLYSVAFLLGTCLLHNFVVTDEKEEYKEKLEEAYERERHQYLELKSAWQLAYTDALTGVKSKLAYAELEEKKDKQMRFDDELAFAVAVFDLNGLKAVNDQKGHEVGDKFIIDACKMICNQFKHSPVFRIGGDEFAVVMEGSDYENRHRLQAEFNAMMEDAQPDKIIIAMGMSDYEPETDKTFEEVFDRADQQMYIRKRELKGRK